MTAHDANDEACGSFLQLPGEHLRWHQIRWKVSEIVTRDGTVLATVEGLSLFPAPGFMPRPPRRVTIGQQTYRVEGRMMNARVTASDGLTILSFTGTKNFNRQAKAVAHLSNGQSLRFSVQGRSKRNAVMTATDDSGETVFRLRQVRKTGRGEDHKKVVEVVIEPGRQITPDLLLVMATGYYNLATFFDRPGGG
jgi:hypothetical protein